MQIRSGGESVGREQYQVVRSERHTGEDTRAVPPHGGVHGASPAQEGTDARWEVVRSQFYTLGLG